MCPVAQEKKNFLQSTQNWSFLRRNERVNEMRKKPLVLFVCVCTKYWQALWVKHKDRVHEEVSSSAASSGSCWFMPSEESVEDLGVPRDSAHVLPALNLGNCRTVCVEIALLAKRSWSSVAK